MDMSGWRDCIAIPLRLELTWNTVQRQVETTQEPPLQRESRATKKSSIESGEDFLVTYALLQAVHRYPRAVAFLKRAIQLDFGKYASKGLFMTGT